MRRLLASDLLPRRAGQPVKALVHIYFAELRELDAGLGAAGHVDRGVPGPVGRPPGRRIGRSPGDGGAWLEGDAARAIVCDAMTVPVVTGDLDPGAVEDLIAACVRYHRIRAEAAAEHAMAAAAQPTAARRRGGVSRPG